MSCVIGRFFILLLCLWFVYQPAVAQCSLEITYFQAKDADCFGTATGSVVADAAYGTPPYNFVYKSETTTYYGGNINYMVAGRYTLTVTDANNCSATKTFTITEPPSIDTRVRITNATCGKSNGEVDVLPRDGYPPYKYRWSDDLPHGASPKDLAPGDYVVTVTDDHYCQDTVHVQIVNKGGVEAAISNTSDVSCFGAKNGSVTVIVNGTGPYSYLWTPAAKNAAAAHNLSAGAYSVIVSDSVGCADTAYAVIHQPAEIITSIQKHDATCGKNNGDASISVKEGTGSYNYFWTPVNKTAEAVTNLAAGTYTVTATDERGCFKKEEVVIDAITFPEITKMIQKDIDCFGKQNGTASPIVKNGFPPYSFSWTNDGNTYTDSSLNKLKKGTYSLTVTDEKGCVATSSVIIAEPDPLTHSVSVVPIDCTTPAGSATINVSGGSVPYTYLWSLNGQTGKTATGLEVGEYKVYVKDRNQCIDSADVKVVNNINLTVSISHTSNVTCAGGNNGSATAQVSGTGPFSFSWYPNGGTSQTAVNLPAGNYTVTVTDAKGCTATVATEIFEPPPLSTSTSVVPTSCGTSNGSAKVTVSGGSGNYTYNWQPGNFTTPEVNALSAGRYLIEIKDANGCLKADEVVIESSSMVTIANIVVSDASCHGQKNASATAKIEGGVAPYTFNWTGNGISSSGNPLQNVAAGTYHLLVTDSEGCSASSGVSIGEPAPLSHKIDILTATCGNANGAATVSEMGGTAPYNYTWPATGTNGPTATGLSTGSYLAYIDDANHCTDSALVDIKNVGGVSATIINTSEVSCYGGNDGAAKVNVVGSAAPFHYAWSGEVATTAIANNLKAGNYQVMVTDEQGCVANASTSITQPAALKTAVEINNTTCNINNGSASVTVSGGTAPYLYAWKPGAPFESTSSNLAAGTYYVTIRDAHGCAAFDSAEIAPSTLPVIDSITKSNVNCFGKNDGTATAKVSLGATPYQYVWTNGTTTFSTATIRNLQPGDYGLKVTDASGCIASGKTTITEPERLQVLVVTQPTSCGINNGIASANALGGISPYRYRWSNGSSEKILSGISSGNYQVACTDANGCSVTAEDVTINPSVPLRISLGKDTIICPGQQVLLNPGLFKSYTWQDNSHNQSYKAMQTGTYTVTVADSIGCQATAAIKVEVSCRDLLFPDAFTPNGDGRNDTFGPLGSLFAIKDYLLTIYNRWGQPVFSAANPYAKWDGKFKANDVGSGTFVWIASYSFNGQAKKIQKGTITVIK